MQYNFLLHLLQCKVRFIPLKKIQTKTKPPKTNSVVFNKLHIVLKTRKNLILESNLFYFLCPVMLAKKSVTSRKDYLKNRNEGKKIVSGSSC